MNTEIKLLENLALERWLEYKELYKRAVKNEPLAFSETVEEIEKTSDDDWRKEIREALAGERILVFAELKGKLIGMGGVNFHRLEKMKHNVFLSSLYVDMEFRGQGIGKQITEKRMELILKNPQIKNIFCEIVESQTVSIELHKKLGFEIVGEFKNIFHVGGKFYSEYYMQKQIRHEH